MKNEGEPRNGAITCGPIHTTNFKTFGLSKKSKRYFECRPRVHIPSLDTKDLYYCPVFEVVIF
jgi:hypothetical protein